MSEEPITIFISRRFKPGTEATVSEWIREVRESCSTFPGFLGAVTLEPHRSSSPHSHIAFRFANFNDLQRWEGSPERAELYRRLQPLVVEEHSSRLSGFEPWFPPQGMGFPAPPAKWKMWLMAQLAVFPTVLLVRFTLIPFLQPLPTVASVFLACIPVSFLMSFVMMPGLTRIFSKWLYSGSK